MSAPPCCPRSFQQVSQLPHVTEELSDPGEPLSRSHGSEPIPIHPSSNSRPPPQRTVLYDDTALRRHTHPLGRVQEEIRRGLPPPHVLRTEDPLVLEPLVQPRR